MTIALRIPHSSLGLALILTMSTVTSAQIFSGADKGTAPSERPVKLDPEVKQTAWPSIPLPRITLPKITMPDMSVITTPVKAGYSKVTEGSRKAWEGTKEMLTFGSGASASAARTQPKESFWTRMFTSEPDKNDGPQTVGEWMAQPRLDP